MQKQHEDIVTAEAHLTGLMEELEDAMRRQFNAKFKDIKRVFQEVFVELFGGGEARLELTDDDVLESGIRSLQPPGKKLQNMIQLSGGEKALMLEISLLFCDPEFKNHLRFVSWMRLKRHWMIQMSQDLQSICINLQRIHSLS